LKPLWKGFLFVTLALLASFLIWGGALYSIGYFDAESEEYVRTVEVGSAKELTVDNDFGFATVRAEDRSDIQIEVYKWTLFGREELDKADIDITTGTVIRVAVDSEDGASLVIIDLTIEVPMTLNVTEVRTEAGRAEVVGTAGKLSISCSAGNVKVIDVGRVEYAKSTTGWVYMRSCGDITRVQTGTGAIDVLDGGTLVEASTDTGSVVVHVKDIPPDGTRIATETAPVVLYVDRNVTADFNMRTDTGRIEITGMEHVFTNSEETHKAGRINGGGPLIELTTVTGDIALRGE